MTGLAAWLCNSHDPKPCVERKYIDWAPISRKGLDYSIKLRLTLLLPQSLHKLLSQEVTEAQTMNWLDQELEVKTIRSLNSKNHLHALVRHDTVCSTRLEVS